MRRIIGGISAVSSIRRPYRNARIVSFIADPGNIISAYPGTLMRTDKKVDSLPFYDLQRGDTHPGKLNQIIITSS